MTDRLTRSDIAALERRLNGWRLDDGESVTIPVSELRKILAALRPTEAETTGEGPRVFVVEERYAAGDQYVDDGCEQPSIAPTGAWSNWRFFRAENHSDTVPEAPHYSMVEGCWVERRVVEYAPVPVEHPGGEVPEQRGDAPPGRNVLGYYGRLGIGWQIARYNFLDKRWESVRPHLGQPDVWRELPPTGDGKAS